MFQENCSNPCR